MYLNNKYILYKRRMLLTTVIKELCEVLTWVHICCFNPIYINLQFTDINIFRIKNDYENYCFLINWQDT